MNEAVSTPPLFFSLPECRVGFLPSKMQESRVARLLRDARAAVSRPTRPETPRDALTAAGTMAPSFAVSRPTAGVAIAALGGRVRRSSLTGAPFTSSRHGTPLSSGAEEWGLVPSTSFDAAPPSEGSSAADGTSAVEALCDVAGLRRLRDTCKQQPQQATLRRRLDTLLRAIEHHCGQQTVSHGALPSGGCIAPSDLPIGRPPRTPPTVASPRPADVPEQAWTLTADILLYCVADRELRAALFTLGGLVALDIAVVLHDDRAFVGSVPVPVFTASLSAVLRVLASAYPQPAARLLTHRHMLRRAARRARRALSPEGGDVELWDVVSGCDSAAVLSRMCEENAPHLLFSAEAADRQAFADDVAACLAFLSRLAASASRQETVMDEATRTNVATAAGRLAYVGSRLVDDPDLGFAPMLIQALSLLPGGVAASVCGGLTVALQRAVERPDSSTQWTVAISWMALVGAVSLGKDGGEALSRAPGFLAQLGSCLGAMDPSAAGTEHTRTLALYVLQLVSNLCFYVADAGPSQDDTAWSTLVPCLVGVVVAADDCGPDAVVEATRALSNVCHVPHGRSWCVQRGVDEILATLACVHRDARVVYNALGSLVNLTADEGVRAALMDSPSDGRVAAKREAWLEAIGEARSFQQHASGRFDADDASQIALIAGMLIHNVSQQT